MALGHSPLSNHHTQPSNVQTLRKGQSQTHYETGADQVSLVYKTCWVRDADYLVTSFQHRTYYLHTYVRTYMSYISRPGPLLTKYILLLTLLLLLLYDYLKASQI